MKNNILIALMLLNCLSIGLTAHSVEVHEATQWVFEFKKPLSCEAAKTLLAKNSFGLDCTSVSEKKMRYFSGSYQGGGSPLPHLVELKKNPEISSIAPSKAVRLNQ